MNHCISGEQAKSDVFVLCVAQEDMYPIYASSLIDLFACALPLRLLACPLAIFFHPISSVSLGL